MSEYKYNTLFTNYAFNKLAKNLVNDGTSTYAYSPYNFLTIKIGNGNNFTDLDKASLSRTLYTLNITDIKVSAGSITFTCEIPEDLEDIEITEIGLFDTINGKDNLFSYSRVQAVKPKDLGYKLVVEINLTLRTVNFYPNLINIVMTPKEFIVRKDLNDLRDAFLWMETNLERIIDFNSEETGKNLAQIYYNQEKKINNSLANFIYSNKYFNLLNKFSHNLKNVFFIKDEPALSFTVRDIADDIASLEVFSGKITSSGDNVQFNSGSTLSFTAELGNFTEGITLLNKESTDDFYFTLRVFESILEFTLNAEPRNITFRYNLTEQELNLLKTSYNTFTVSFNGVISAPIVYMYLNGKLLEGEQDSSPIESVVDKSPYSLRNYNVKGASETPIDLTSIIFLDRAITDDEAYFLYMSQKVRNE